TDRSDGGFSVSSLLTPVCQRPARSLKIDPICASVWDEACSIAFPIACDVCFSWLTADEKPVLKFAVWLEDELPPPHPAGSSSAVTTPTRAMKACTDPPRSSPDPSSLKPNTTAPTAPASNLQPPRACTGAGREGDPRGAAKTRSARRGVGIRPRRLAVANPRRRSGRRHARRVARAPGGSRSPGSAGRRARSAGSDAAGCGCRPLTPLLTGARPGPPPGPAGLAGPSRRGAPRGDLRR